jgi:hypothetical protein
MPSPKDSPQARRVNQVEKFIGIEVTDLRRAERDSRQVVGEIERAQVQPSALSAAKGVIEAADRFMRRQCSTGVAGL